MEKTINIFEGSQEQKGEKFALWNAECVNGYNGCITSVCVRAQGAGDGGQHNNGNASSGEAFKGVQRKIPTCPIPGKSEICL